MARVELFAWNERKSGLPLAITERLPIALGRRVNNFGDLLGPVIVQRLLASHGIIPDSAVADRRLLSIGSVLHFARDNDVIWGTGVNGKIPDSHYLFQSLDVRAVRGPRTRAFLNARGIEAPTIFGDPALLLPDVMPELVALSAHKRFDYTVVPNLNDLRAYEKTPHLLNPRSPVEVCLRRIAQSEMVIGSSLHAIIVAESLGIPAQRVASSVEEGFKYEDYYLGTGRTQVRVASTVSEALEIGGAPEPIVDRHALVNAFPFDLWRGDAGPPSAG